jgi:hypothetical protein
MHRMKELYGVKHTPYNQDRFSERHHQAKDGFCSGLIIDEVTDEENNAIQGLALMRHLRAKARWKEHLAAGGPKTSVASVSVLKDAFIEEKKLSEQVSDVKVEEAANGEQAAAFIEKYSNNFRKHITFLSGFNVHDEEGEKIGRHATRFTSHGNGKCSLYDGNEGLDDGHCGAVLERYRAIIEKYKPTDGAIAGISLKR